MKTWTSLGTLAVCAVALAAGDATAQDGRKHLTLAGITSGTVAPHGLAFASLSGTDNSPAGKVDGSLALGFGLGSAEDNIGVQVTAQITSLTDAFGDSGYLQFKLSRRLGQRPLYLGLQADHLIAWGDSELVDPSGKLALTYFTSVAASGDTFPVMMTLGAGTHVRDVDEPGFFAGVGVGLTESLGASLAFSGDYFDLGLGLRVNDAISLTAAVNDLLDQEDRRRVTVSVTYAMPDLFGR